MKDNIYEKYNQITTPEELLEFMSYYINYGYLSIDGRVYNYNDDEFFKNWYNKYVLQTTNQMLSTKVGTCWDQVEFARDWFLNHNYEIKTIYVMVELNYQNNYPTHSFLIYKSNNRWNWFENSDVENRGIHSFNTIDNLIKYQLATYIKLLKTYDIKDSELKNIIIKEFKKPKENIKVDEYLNWVVSEKDIKIQL